jgi:4-diphosphocytidyl-2-C-methyl-D-erythritol kinase
MVIFPRAKINIGLRITEKRQDGFHNLQTIFYPVCLRDGLEFVVPAKEIKEDEISVTGLYPDLLKKENLVIKALNKLRETNKIPYLRIHLHKVIPAGAGLGGGSSDAAGFLKCLIRYFKIDIGNTELKEIALSLGSDCPFFIESIPAYAEGRGELLSPLNPLKDGFHLVLMNPGIKVNTKEAYSECVPFKTKESLPDYYNQDIHKWKKLIINDFEKTVFKKYPQIAVLKEDLYNTGAVYSSMSGSGSTVYGIFETKPQIPEKIKGMVLYSGVL